MLSVLSDFCQKNKFMCKLFKLSGILCILIIIMLLFINYFVLINKVNIPTVAPTTIPVKIS